MPTLHWLTREQDMRAAANTEYRLLTEDARYGCGDPGSGNCIVQGDNLEALKALLPFYAAQAQCIYIDPPYNTGSAFAHYDDNMEHTKWLSMMYPRLELLKQFLREDGSIWISMDDDETHYLKVICDEIFGRSNFIASCIWHKKHTRSNDARWFSDNHDYILVYAKCKNTWRPNLLPRADDSDKGYTNPDNDPRGVWASNPCHVKTPSQSCIYPITTPSGRKISPPNGRSWMVTKERFQELIKDNRIWFGLSGDNAPRHKKFLSEVKDGFVPTTLWFRDEVGDNQEAKTEIKLLHPEDVFATPKPERLLQRILHLATKPGDLVLDSFLGSGTTAAVAHKMGRRYIGIEMGEQATTHAAVRLRKVIEGEQGGISKAVGWQGGGGFRFFTLGDAIFDNERRIKKNIRFASLAAHIYFTETKTPRSARSRESTFLGIHAGTAYALLYNGILGDISTGGGNVLTQTTLARILRDIGIDTKKSKAAYSQLVIYGEAVRLGQETLRRAHIIFKQTPYDIKVW
ncbi:MAG: site-specific DNA-methyltransferase [Spirochaetota bacterium]|jgi:adenine-specific DNA-methyltransferase|nr:site-specific DNA-methyltransferase [Spirochaetota bacterium]